MKRFLLAIILLIGTQLTIFSQVLFTDSTQLSLLTCAPGDVAYQKFGHSAIRIYDKSQSLDIVANWGVFSFNQPDFYYKFIKGETYYQLGIAETSYFLEEYRMRNSSVREQVLNLTKEEGQALLDVVFENYRPENRKYLYNFVFDNCATRPKVLILDLLKNKEFYFNAQTETLTFREWVGECAGKYSWLMFGIDLVFGKEADRLATKDEAMFLPEVLSQEFKEMKIQTSNSKVTIPLIKEERFIVSQNENIPTKSGITIHPIVITSFVLFVGLIVAVVENKKNKYYRLLDVLLFICTGLAGVIIFYLSFFSIHPLVKMNFNILWCCPLNILAAIFICSKNEKMRAITRTYSFIYCLMIIIALIVSALHVQMFNVAFLPIITLMLLRSINIVQQKFKTKKEIHFRRK